ncbi:AraC family transcriptional regulator [Sphingomonas sp.]|uniref:AraC family transcriptional regulator n=1 Tax=Sphingomonas sp. TaxID=28214 RepID=UPI001B0E173E|nr:AraC family transcriptional regulator [Sphingomonas sp.]MBO9712103.1 AraC family transcriptional regulator ligand-binding domain-containing protein [Sphingomonas sp.]
MTDAADKCLTPRAFWRALEDRGVAPAAVLRRAGLPASLHLNPEGYVTTAQLFAIWKAVEALTGDRGFGIALVERRGTGARRPALLAAHYAASFRDALALLADSKRYGGCFELHVEEGGGEFAIEKRWLFAAEPEPPLSADVSFASLLDLARKGTGRHLVPLRMEFAAPGPATDAHRAYFGCPIRHDAPRNRLVLRAADVDLPFAGHNPEMLALLAPALRQMPGELRSLGERIKATVQEALAEGRPELGEVARRLAMSERTLQRRIAEEGTGFRALVQDARRDLARRLLTDPAIEIDRVAALLGYGNTSAFCRAFRAWEGVTPGECRAGMI